MSNDHVVIGTRRRRTKFQQIKLDVFKRPVYRGQPEKFVLKRYENALHNEKQHEVKKKEDTLGEEGSRRLKVLQSLSKEGILEKYSATSKRERALGIDAETGERIRIGDISTAKELTRRLRESSAMERLMEDVSSKLTVLGRDLERKKCDRDGQEYSPAVRLLRTRTGCADDSTARYYLGEAGWDPSMGIEKYFKGMGHLPRDGTKRRETDIFRTDDEHSSSQDRGMFETAENRRLAGHLRRVQTSSRDFKTILSETFQTRRPFLATSKVRTKTLSRTTRAKVPTDMTLTDHLVTQDFPHKALQAMRRGHVLQISKLIEEEEAR